MFLKHFNQINLSKPVNTFQILKSWLFGYFWGGPFFSLWNWISR